MNTRASITLREEFQQSVESPFLYPSDDGSLSYADQVALSVGMSAQPEGYRPDRVCANAKLPLHEYEFIESNIYCGAMSVEFNGIDISDMTLFPNEGNVIFNSVDVTDIIKPHLDEYGAIRGMVIMMLADDVREPSPEEAEYESKISAETPQADKPRSFPNFDTVNSFNHLLGCKRYLK